MILVDYNFLLVYFPKPWSFSPSKSPVFGPQSAALGDRLSFGFDLNNLNMLRSKLPSKNFLTLNCIW